MKDEASFSAAYLGDDRLDRPENVEPDHHPQPTRLGVASCFYEVTSAHT